MLGSEWWDLSVLDRQKVNKAARIVTPRCLFKWKDKEYSFEVFRMGIQPQGSSDNCFIIYEPTDMLYQANLCELTLLIDFQNSSDWWINSV